MTLVKKKVCKRLETACRLDFWRRGRDSNPREIALKLISSQPRYDRFDTSPCIFQLICLKINFRKKKRKDEEKTKNIEFLKC